MTVWDKIKAACGSQAELARRIGVTPMTVSQWKTRKSIPPQYVLLIEAATAYQVSRHELRPDIYPVERIKQTAA